MFRASERSPFQLRSKKETKEEEKVRLFSSRDLRIPPFFSSLSGEKTETRLTSNFSVKDDLVRHLDEDSPNNEENDGGLVRFDSKRKRSDQL